MPDIKEVPAPQVGTIHPNNLGMLDFSESCLQIGVKREGKPVRWTELDEADWRILYMLLTRKLTADGRSAATESNALSNLASYAEAVINWYQDQGSKP